MSYGYEFKRAEYERFQAWIARNLSWRNPAALRRVTDGR